MRTRFFTLISALIFAVSLTAKPAYRGGIEKVQPDGSVITIYQHGDEFFHYTTLEDGTWVARNTGGFYEAIPALSREQIAVRRQQSSRFRKTEQIQQAAPLNIAPKGLVVLINFSDTKMQSGNTRDVFDRMHNAPDYRDNGAYGSARQYFIDQSMGKYQPQFDVVGPVTLPKKMSYYGSNDATGNDKMNQVAEMVQDACKLADKAGVDFSQYDNNNDGMVDFVYFIYAGYGEADSGIAETVWPHMYWLYEGNGITLTLDGKKINTYACGSELNYGTKKRDGIATFCHEFSHVLGLPDMYTTDGSNHKTLGMWDILDYGPYNNDGNTPPSYSAYERFFLGWLEPTILNSASTVTIPELQSSNAAGLIAKDGTHNLIGNDPNPTTFFLLENRQQTGWDTYIPGHGMLITLIRYRYDMWVRYNNVNNTPSRMGVDIIEADGEAPAYSGYLDGYFGKLTDAFPHGATEYTPSYYAAGTGDNVFDNYPLTQIVEEGGQITFDFMGGGTPTNLKDPNAVSDIVLGEEEVVAIYNLLGQLQQTTDINELTSGIYIIKTTHTTKKVSIR